MQEATKRLYIDCIVKAALLITASVCECNEQDLRVDLEVQLRGKLGVGPLDYLIWLLQVIVDEHLLRAPQPL